MSMLRDKDHVNVDPWWKFVYSVEDLNDNQKNTIVPLIQKILDKSIPYYLLHTIKDGGIQDISSIERKPYKIGTQFKYIFCSKTGIILCLYIQTGKLYYSHLSYSDLNITTDGSLNLYPITRGCGQPDHSLVEDVDTILPSDLFQGGSWFASITTCKHIMKEGHRSEGIVMTYHCFPLSDVCRKP